MRLRFGSQQAQKDVSDVFISCQAVLAMPRHRKQGRGLANSTAPCGGLFLSSIRCEWAEERRTFSSSCRHFSTSLWERIFVTFCSTARTCATAGG